MHKTFMRLDFKPVAQLQRRLNHVMKEVVMKVVFLKKVNDCSFHGLGFGTNVKKKLKSDIRENERK